MISVILATYKPQYYIKECIESLYKQTLSFDKYEVLVILNGSNQFYYNQLRENLEKYPTCFKIKIIQVDKSGVSNARNIGLEQITGEMVCFIDDDDIVSDSYLEEFETHYEKNHIIVSNVKNFVSDVNNCSDDYLGKAFITLKQEKDFNLFKFRRLLSSACCKAIPVNLIQEVRFVKNHKVGEDAYFMAKLSYQVKKINFTSDRAIYFRRLRTSSASRKKKKIIQKINERFLLIFDYFVLYTKNFPKYNLKFILSRIVASFIQIIK